MPDRWPGSTIPAARLLDALEGALNGVDYFTHHLLHDLRTRLLPEATSLSAKHRGKTAILGFEDAGEWVPLFRLAGASASFNVMDLWIRRRSRWAMTDVRGTPAIVAQALAGPLRPFWSFELTGSLHRTTRWNKTSENED